MERPENNRYGYTYVVDDDSDLTPDEEENREPLDAYVLPNDITNLMLDTLDGAGPNWYDANQEIAGHFFSGPTYPQVAIDSLGYPNNGDGGGAFQPGFNAPPAAANNA